MVIPKLNKNFVGRIPGRKVSAGDYGKYAFIGVDLLYVPKECIGKDIKITIKVEID